MPPSVQSFTRNSCFSLVARRHKANERRWCPAIANELEVCNDLFAVLNLYESFYTLDAYLLFLEDSLSRTLLFYQHFSISTQRPYQHSSFSPLKALLFPKTLLDILLPIEPINPAPYKSVDYVSSPQTARTRPRWLTTISAILRGQPFV